MQTHTLLSNGRTIIPKALRKALALQDGDQITWFVRDGELIGSTVAMRIKRAQDIVARHIKPGAPSIVDELIADRRNEAAKAP